MPRMSCAPTPALHAVVSVAAAATAVARAARRARRVPLCGLKQKQPLLV